MQLLKTLFLFWWYRRQNKTVRSILKRLQVFIGQLQAVSQKALEQQEKLQQQIERLTSKRDEILQVARQADEVAKKIESLIS